ncbi:hypothetical protein CJU89_1575 [Yarrowia sp. B02]|nr:hypothetical protein CJU89_1575 [Yarrowia sp. B02]
MDPSKALEKLASSGLLSVGSPNEISDLSVALRDKKYQPEIGKVLPELCEVFELGPETDNLVIVSYLRIIGNCVSDNEVNRAILLDVWLNQDSFRHYMSSLVKQKNSIALPFYSAVLFNWANGDDPDVKEELVHSQEFTQGLVLLFETLTDTDFVSIGTLLTMLQMWAIARLKLDHRILTAVYQYLLNCTVKDSNVPGATELLLVMVNDEETGKMVDFEKLYDLVHSLSQDNPDDALLAPLDLRRALYTSLVCASESITMKQLEFVYKLKELKFWDPQLAGIGPSCWIAVTSTLVTNETDLSTVLKKYPHLIEESLFLLQTGQYTDQLQSGGHFLKLASNKKEYCVELSTSPLLKQGLTNLLSFPYIPELRLLGAQILLNVVKHVSNKDTDALLKTLGAQFYKSEADTHIKNVLQTAISYCSDLDRDMLDHVIDGLAGPISPLTMRLTTVVGVHAAKLDESQRKKVKAFLERCVGLDKSEGLNKGVVNNAAYICKVGDFGDDLLRQLI